MPDTSVPPALPETLDATALDRLFREARTQNKWLDKPVPTEKLVEIYELLKWGPTSANSSPARFVFVTSPEAKAKLKQALSPGNVEKTMTAPVTVIVAHDLHFYDKLPVLFPHVDAKSWFAGNWSLAEQTAFRNGTLQGAYLMLAARAVGLDVGAMSGFDNNKVDELFFAGRPWKSNFLVNLGYGDPSGLFPRSPRLAFEEACEIV
ncbi:MAG: malonic semialdehyde reductase [Acetobacteraceae bacterium]|nr:malonic semialdehyde reductase [Acetobacteraceae bacterium]MCX7685371.1 malonic semialdehyde reductase [Acetobacteraceae bacterium]MDW8397711.1 malonic semialdehyde reductase [Acetobacteraceae bacterium]